MPKTRIEYKQKAAFIRQFESLHFNNRVNFNTVQKRLLTRKYNHYKRFTGIRHIELNKKTRNDLKSRGYAVTGKGVFIDDIRDGVGNKIQGSNVRLLNNGIIKVSIGKKGKRAATRIDYIYSFNKKEKEQFVKTPEQFIINLINSIPILKKNFSIKTLRNKAARQHIRFQIGAYGTHSALTLDVLEFYLKEKAGNEATRGFFDVITGLRFVKFTPVKPPIKKKSKKKSKKKAGKKK